MFFVLLLVTFGILPRVQQGYFPFPAMEKKVLNEIGLYSACNYISRVFLRMPPLVLPLIVINILGSQMNAYFYIAWLIAMSLTIIPNSISNSLFAEGSTKEESLRANVIRSLKLIFLLSLPVIVVIWVLADKILLLFGQEYSHNGALLLRITVLSSIPWSINYLYITIGRVRKNISSLIKVSVALTCLTLGLSYFLILKMGLVGVGIGYLAGQSIVAGAIAIYLLWRYYSPAKVLDKSG
jgi:O-antigen/teichoic acid export membrane protein